MFIPTPVDPTQYDLAELERQLDRVKVDLFLGKHTNAAFFGPLMSGLKFGWTTSISTAMTNGVELWWNPDFFLKSPETMRLTVLMHELKHCAFLHILRMEGKDPELWNIATDIVINNELDDDGFDMTGFPYLMDHQYDGLAAEQVYEDIQQQCQAAAAAAAGVGQPQPGTGPPGSGKPELPWGLGDPDAAQHGGDLAPLSQEQKQTAVNNVIQATHAAQAAGNPGDVPGETRERLASFLAPVIPWEKELRAFFTELTNPKYDWTVRDRRYANIYLPGRSKKGRTIAKLRYYLDVSGSVTNEQVIRFNSEVRHIKQTFNPELLTLVQFDVKIQDIQEFKRQDKFEELLVVGRGGTSLKDVREDILKHMPTAAIVFSDLDCRPMVPLPKGKEVPIIWICIANPHAQGLPSKGRVIHIEA